MGLKSVILLSVILAGVAVLIKSNVFSETLSPLIISLQDSVHAAFNNCPCGSLKYLLSHLFPSFDDLNNAGSQTIPVIRYGNDRIFTKEELTYYKGDEDSRGLYLAVLGQVYDVAKGKRHYGPGCSYHFFAGVDGTKAFVTGDFTDKGLIDDVADLRPEQMLELENWIDFYAKSYDYKGKVVGNFYDEKGQPTAALMAVKDLIEEGHLNKKKDDEFRLWFPPCNSAHTSEGGWVSCSDKNGGIQRDWVGVPRKYHFPGKPTPRCVCVRTEGPPYDNPESTSNHGDLDNPHLEEYEGCDPMAQTCRIL